MIACPSCGTLNVPGTTHCMRCRNPMPTEGQAAQGGGFGAQPPQGGGFGAPPEQGGGSFGQPPQGATGGGGYGQPPQAGSSYGQPAPGGYPPAAPPSPGVDVGDVLRATFEAWKRNFVLLAMLNAVCSTPGWLFSASGGIYQATQATSGTIPSAGAAGVVLALTIVGVVVSLLCNSVAFGAATRIGLDDLGGGHFEGIGPALAYGLSRIGTSLGVMVLSWIGIVIGMFLCVVPGVIVSTMISVAMPVAVAEGKGVIDSLTRSVDVTAGNRTNIFVVYLALVLVAIVVVFPIFCCLGMAAGGAGAVGGAVVGAVIMQVLTLGLTIAMAGYFQLLGVTLYQRLTGYGTNTDGAAVAQVFR